MQGSDSGTGSADRRVAAIGAAAAYAMTKNRDRRHLLSAVIMAAEQSERVRALIAGSESDVAAESMLMSELGLDQLQARTVLDMQFRRLPAAQRQKAIDEHNAALADYAAERWVLAAVRRFKFDRGR